MIVKKKKGERERENLPNIGLWRLADYKVKLKDSEKIDIYLDLARELKKYGK